MNKKTIFKTTRYVLIAILLIPLFSMAPLAKSYSNREMIEKSAACLDCHEDKVASLEGTAHRMGDKDRIKSVMVAGCIGCHAGWEKHLEEPSKETISILPSLSALDQAKVCGECHLGQHQSGMVSTDPHLRAGIACLTCHSIHANSNPKLLKEAGANFCITCHPTVADEFKRRSMHPLESGNVTCVDCHAMADMKDPTLARGIDWTCQNCHSELSGPFIHEHPVNESYLVNGGGCSECHEPHGSQNERLLRQPVNGVCVQCHAIPPRHRSEHSGLGAKADCVLCHTGIHGSNTSRKFLDPDLRLKFVADCYQAGCHNPDN